MTYSIHRADHPSQDHNVSISQHHQLGADHLPAFMAWQTLTMFGSRSSLLLISSNCKQKTEVSWSQEFTYNKALDM